MSEDETMSTVDAINYVTEYFGIQSMYALAKSLSDEELTVQTIQISNYIKGKRMTKKVANRFFITYGVIINDAYTPGVFQQ